MRGGYCGDSSSRWRRNPRDKDFIYVLAHIEANLYASGIPPDKKLFALRSS
jgi:hypothetical protein